jgi:hypothetical protein
MTRFTTAFALASIMFCGATCAQTPPAPKETPQSGPKETQPEAFNSPDQAVDALIGAVAKNDRNELTVILGSQARSVLTSGNAAQDEQERAEFSRLAAAKHHVERSMIDSGTAVLLVGDQDWPFPIPLVRTGQKWHFDPELGSVEMQARKIGADELDAIEICLGYVNAQQTYSQQQLSTKGPAGYAQKIMSSPGSKDGLYQTGSSQALVPEGFATAAASTAAAHRKPYHGYYFRVLREQGPDAPGGAHKYVAGGAMIGGFALIATPAEYGGTGIHTFIVSHDGVVFEKDLGSRTAAQAAQVSAYDPDSTWTAVDTSDAF